MTPRPDPLIGYCLLGKFEVEKKLGSGGFGSVYRARHVQTGGHVAVKLLRPEIAEDQDAVRRFYIEAQNTHRLRHPNTVTVSDFGRDENGVLYLIMEFVDGRSLASVLREEGRLAPARAVRILEQVLKSLGEAHAARIVHRDIKPDNVMLLDEYGEQDFVKVLDFGISRALDTSGAHTGTGALGTPKYMAPEQWRGQPLDGRADLYAVGCMAYQILAGRPPFVTDASPAAVAYMHAHLRQPPPPLLRVAPGVCPPELARLVMSLLAKDRAHRPANVEAVFAQLAEIKRTTHLADETATVVGMPAFELDAEDPIPDISPQDGAVASVRAGEHGHTQAIAVPAASKARPPAARPPRLRTDAPGDASSTGIPRSGAFRVPRAAGGVSPWIVGVAVGAVFLVMVGGAGLWLMRDEVWPAAGFAEAPILAANPAAAESEATAATAEFALAQAPSGQQDETPAEPTAEQAALQAAADPSAEDAGARPAAAESPRVDPPAAADAEPVPPPAPPPEAPAPAPVVVEITSDPAGAELRRDGQPDLLGTTPFSWTVPDDVLAELDAGGQVKLILKHGDGHSGVATLAAAALASDAPALAVALKPPKARRPARRASRRAPAEATPASKPAATGTAAPTFHF